jgi:hypothetical protein
VRGFQYGYDPRYAPRAHRPVRRAAQPAYRRPVQPAVAAPTMRPRTAAPRRTAAVSAPISAAGAPAAARNPAPAPGPGTAPRSPRSSSTSPRAPRPAARRSSSGYAAGTPERTSAPIITDFMSEIPLPTGRLSPNDLPADGVPASYCPCPGVGGNVGLRPDGRCKCQGWGPSYTLFTPPPSADGDVSAARAATRPGEHLIFADEFKTLDTSVWEHEITAGGGGNYEFQHYTNNRSNSFVQEGVLYLRPTLTVDTIGEENIYPGSGFALDLGGNTPASRCTSSQFFGCYRMAGGGGNILNPVQSARLRSTTAFTLKYGRVEVRAQMPKGDWIWPAIWMLPRYEQYGGWPASGEIDIVETKGNAPGYPAHGYDRMYSTLHWGPSWNLNSYNLTHAVSSARARPGETFADKFHVFGLYWDENELYTYVDNEDNKILHVPFDSSFFADAKHNGVTTANPWRAGAHNAPFDTEFYLVMNVAVGGINFFPDGVGNKPWSNKSRHAMNEFWNARRSWEPTWCSPQNPTSCAMKVDYVRAWTFDKSYVM